MQKLLLDRKAYKYLDPDLWVNVAQVLGKGAYGTVYQGLLKRNDQIIEVAVKVIPAMQACVNEEDVLREINCLLKVNCQNVAQFYGVRRTPNNIYLISELCDGGSLQDKLEHLGKFTEEEAIKIIKQITKAFLEMSNIKENGTPLTILHRDLKSQNIMFQGNEVKIIDFGFSKMIKKNEGLKLMKHSVLGTKYYTSPQMLESVKYSAKNDVWSAGVILYEMLMGKKPWTVIGVDEDDLLLMIKNQKLVIPETVSPAVTNLLASMLEIEEENRLSWEEVWNHPAVRDK